MWEFKFEQEFNEQAKVQGLIDPFWLHQKKIEEECFQINFEDPYKEEKKNWIKMRDEYIARRCFEEVGYDEFLKWTKNLLYMREMDEFAPCRSADRQCRFSCKYIGGKCNEENL